MKFRSVIVGLMLALGLVASASAKKMPVYVECTTDVNDYTGKRICSELRDFLATSPRYYEVSSNKKFHWGVHLVSTTVGDSSRPIGASAQSVSFTFGDDTELYLSGFVFITGDDRAKPQAKRILSSLDDLATTFSQAFADHQDSQEQEEN